MWSVRENWSQDRSFTKGLIYSCQVVQNHVLGEAGVASAPQKRKKLQVWLLVPEFSIIEVFHWRPQGKDIDSAQKISLAPMEEISIWEFMVLFTFLSSSFFLLLCSVVWFDCLGALCVLLVVVLLCFCFDFICFSWLVVLCGEVQHRLYWWDWWSP